MRKYVLMVFSGIAVAGVLFYGFYFLTWYGFQEERRDVEFGVTFSTVMARQLGLDSRKVFDAIIDDLGARKINHNRDNHCGEHDSPILTSFAV